MPKDKSENHDKILIAAREEFSKKGFEGASIRDIGKKVGISSAALYRHCKDKEDLFCQLVEDSVNVMNRWLEAHICSCYQGYDEGMAWEDVIASTSELDLIREIIYPRREDFRLILLKSKGTKYENFLDHLIDEEQKGIVEAMKIVERKKQNNKEKSAVSDKELRALLTAYTNALMEPVVHDYTREEMEHCMQTVGKFFMPGWKVIMGF